MNKAKLSQQAIDKANMMSADSGQDSRPLTIVSPPSNGRLVCVVRTVIMVTSVDRILRRYCERKP